jgi:hypothetical protein
MKINISRKRLIKYAIICVVAFSIIEIGLRLYGFRQAVLMREDNAYEYIPIPQKQYRFGKNIYYNTFSQRSTEIQTSDSVLICAFGDSFINGGVVIDQDSLATTKLSAYLSKKYMKPVKLLNISAGSWGPDNCFAYLLKHGNFNSKQFVLFVSSHDAYDNMTFNKVVGVNIKYPTQQYNFAIQELVVRYIIPKIQSGTSNWFDETGINKKTEHSVFNTGFASFYNYCKQNGIALTIYLHPDKEEAINKKYNEQGDSIINFCASNNVRLIKELQFNFPITYYRDRFHFNDMGQEAVFESIKDSIVIK